MIATSLDIKEMDPTPTEKFVIQNRLITLLCPTTACEVLLRLTQGNAEVESSLS